MKATELKPADIGRRFRVHRGAEEIHVGTLSGLQLNADGVSFASFEVGYRCADCGHFHGTVLAWSAKVIDVEEITE